MSYRSTSQYGGDDTREPGVCDMQVVEVLMENSNLTLGFDATTLISVQITSIDDCCRFNKKNPSQTNS